MKHVLGWAVSALAILAAGAAQAQVLAPYEVGRPYAVGSDVGGSYAAVLPEITPSRYGPILLPAMEVYTVVRESGFSPLGIPQQRGLIYTISVINRDGEDGRLVIDARTGRIIRFMPAYRMGDNFNNDLTVAYGPVGPLPPPGDLRRAPRPSAPVPRVASRSVAPLPKMAPNAMTAPKPIVAQPISPTPQQSAAVQTKPVDAKPTAPVIVEAKPSVQIQPTQDMPKVQGLE
jgi:hypothetical protein